MLFHTQRPNCIFQSRLLNLSVIKKNRRCFYFSIPFYGNYIWNRKKSIFSVILAICTDAALSEFSTWTLLSANLCYFKDIHKSCVAINIAWLDTSLSVSPLCSSMFSSSLFILGQDLYTNVLKNYSAHTKQQILIIKKNIITAYYT